MPIPYLTFALAFSLHALTPSAADGLGERMDEYLTRLEGHGFSGVAIVARGERVELAKAYGRSDRERDLPMSVETPMPLGSISKHFTAVAVLRLEMDGSLSVKDPLEAFFEDVPRDKRGITLHQLLCHTSGMPGASGMMSAPDRETFVRDTLNMGLAFPPGARMGYSNAGYELLAAVVEVVSGAPFEEFLIESLFEPLGMNSTGAILPDWEPATIPHGYIDDQDTGTLVDRIRARGAGWRGLGSGGLSTTVLDMQLWARALDEGELLSPEALARMMHPHARMAPGIGYGYGCGVSTSIGGTQRVGHTGSDDIFSAVFRWFPEEAAFLFVAGNDADAYAEDVSTGLEQLMYGGEARLAPEVVELSDAQLAARAGKWRLGEEGQVEVEVRAGGLRLHSADFEGAALLHPVRPGQVTRRRELATRLEDAFARAFEGEFERLQQLILPFDPLDEFAAMHAEMFDRWAAELGPFAGVRAIPGRNRFGEIALVAVLELEAGERRIEYSFGPREVGSIRVIEHFPQRVVRPMSPDRFIDHDMQAELAFEIEFKLDDADEPIALILTGEDGKARKLTR